MKSVKKATNTAYVTYKWLLTTIIASAAGIMAIIGGIANTAFYPKPAGAAVEQKIEATDKRLDEIQLTMTEVRQDVKLLLARKR